MVETLEWNAESVYDMRERIQELRRMFRRMHLSIWHNRRMDVYHRSQAAFHLDHHIVLRKHCFDDHVNAQGSQNYWIISLFIVDVDNRRLKKVLTNYAAGVTKLLLFHIIEM